MFGPAHADLQLAAVGQQLQLDARHRQADAAGAVDAPVHAGDGRRGPAPQDEVNHSGRLPAPWRPPPWPRPGLLRQRGACVEHAARFGRSRRGPVPVRFEVGSSMSKPRGTLKWKFGRTSRRLATVFSIRPGAGRPSSTQAYCRRWAAPCEVVVAAEGVAPRQPVEQAQPVAREEGPGLRDLFWLAQSMRWLLTTTLGTPVEPEVSRYLAGQCGRIAAKAVHRPATFAVEQRRRSGARRPPRSG